MRQDNEKIIVMSIMSYYARQIFDGTKKFEFRKSALKPQDLNKTIYVYSAKNDKAIIGSFQVEKVHKGTLDEILKITGYDTRPDRQEIVDYYRNCQACYALQLTNVRRFSKPMTLNELRRLDKNIQLPQYYCYIYPKSPIYQEVVKLK